MEHQTETMALEVSGLSYAFGSTSVLSNVELQISPGEFVVLLGPNGAGKTTLISLITRLYAKKASRIFIYGHNINRSPGGAMRSLGAVFQQRTLDLDLSSLQNMIYHGSLHGIGRSDAFSRATFELERAGLGDKGSAKVRQLSGGQVRRLEIARALLHKPRLLILDEPTAGLDTSARQALLETVHGLCQVEQMAVLWATHLLDEIGSNDRVVVLNKGHVCADTNASSLASQNSTNSLREAYLDLISKGTG